jgi:hypothetical protein
MNVNVDDEGIYACEVNTQPPQKAFVHLYVQGKFTDFYFHIFSIDMRDHSLHLPFISKRMKLRSPNGNHGSGMMRVSICLMSILTVKVKHHARIEMINTF